MDSQAPSPVVINHVENRRLQGAANGTLLLLPWEREHIHQCETCQGVFYVLLNQPLDIQQTRSTVPDNEPRISDAQ